MTSAQDEIARQQAIDADDDFTRRNRKLLRLVKTSHDLHIELNELLMDTWHREQERVGHGSEACRDTAET